MTDETGDRESNTGATAKPCKVFISYSYDSDAHKAWVLRLAKDLRTHGIDATLDQWDLVPGQDLLAFMERGIREADRVLMVCSEKYIQKADARLGGVGYEGLFITAEIFQSTDTKKFIPLIRDNDGPVKTPGFLGSRVYIDFTNDASYEKGLEDLVRDLVRVPALPKPPLGVSPFSQEARNIGEPTRIIGPMGITESAPHVLDDEWFERQQTAAARGIKALGFCGHMEVRFGLLHHEISISQAELLTAVQNSQIDTFGWPIAVTLDIDEYRPRPCGDGIRAEISIVKDSSSSSKSYDYWAVRRNGDFFLLQNLFEDMRGNNLMFFDTRIIRVAEAFLFASSLYTNLNVPPEASLSAQISHRGLAGRMLMASKRDWYSRGPKISHEEEAKEEIPVAMGSIKDDLVDIVRHFTQPLFMLFDFQEFPEQKYADIVRRFEQGIHP